MLPWLHLAPSISRDSPNCSQDAQNSLTSTQHGLLGQIFFDLASIRDPKPSKKLQKPRVFQGFLIFSLTAKKPPKSSKIDPKSFQNRAKIAILAAFGGLLGAILALLGAILAHLGALGRHLGSSWGSWAPSWLVLGLLVAILPPKMSQHSSNMSQDSPNSNRHRPKRPPRDPRDLIFSSNFDLQSFIPEELRSLWDCKPRGRRQRRSLTITFHVFIAA